MSAWTNYNNIVIPSSQPSVVRPRFSLTSDILSYRRCSRQYGYFGNDGFVSAQATHIFFSTVIHQVLGRCYRHYWGFSDHPQGAMPTDGDLARAGRRGRQPRRIGHNLLLRLMTRKPDVIRFLTDPRVPFTNNLAEPDGRMMKLRQKISGGFRDENGANKQPLPCFRLRGKTKMTVLPSYRG